jgi:predicted TIM-barrel enzyme
MDDIADLQAQLIALRMAVEGTWLSLLHNDPTPADTVAKLKDANVAAVNQLATTTPNDKKMRDAVAAHTAQLWGSIEWQIQNPAENKS